MTATAAVVTPIAEAQRQLPLPQAPPAPVRIPTIRDAATLARVTGPASRARRAKDMLVYLHVPFCSSKCHFCDWVVGYNKADLVNTGDLRARYVDALCKQIEAYGPVAQNHGYRVTNIYWGGGTPTRLTPQQMGQIYDTLASVMDLSAVREHTAECSPETVTAAHLDVLRERGLNRASAGAQSFDPQILRRMGRAHNAGQIERAVELFHAAGLKNFNLDLITGFPQQTSESSLGSIRQAIDSGVPHVSLYMFREFSNDLVSVKQVQAGHSAQRSRQERASAYYEAKHALEAAGYEEYVVGYFAKSPETYFDSEDYYFSLRGDYLGFGAGAGSVLGHWVLKSGDASRYGDSHVREFVADPLVLTAGPARSMPDVLFTDGYFKAFATKEGIRYDRWNDQYGFAFRDFVAQRPAIARWFDEQRAQGAEFIEDAQGIRLSQETWIDSMLWRR